MNSEPLRLGVLVVLLLVAGGCTRQALQYTALDSPSGAARQVELVATPFHPQAAYQCGPAALATLLQSSGVANADPEQLAEQVYLPGLRGSLQAELLGATRRAERVPYVLAPRLDDLITELRAGHPVLVLQNLRLSPWPQWHYAVVIGFDMDAQTLVLRSGETRRHTMSFRRFEQTWHLADYWAFVVVAPGEIPATATPHRYVEAVAVLEHQQRFRAAMLAYQAAQVRWPDDPMSYLGLGNIAYTQGAFALAADHFRGAIEVAPDLAAAHYNLAWAYLRQGDSSNAQASARRAERLAPDHPRYGQAAQLIAEQANTE